MRITVNEKLCVEYPPQDLRNWCRVNLVMDNPDYYKREAMGKWTGGTPQTISLYEAAGNTLYLPFGCLQDLWAMYGKEAEWINEIAPKRAFYYESGINLYDYQKTAVMAAIRRKNGILVMPCGSGKTQCGLEIISRIGGRALWLTHTQDLLNQSKKRAESTIGKAGIGTITEGKVNIGNGITFATVQTLCKIDLRQYTNFWDVVIVDECQHCSGSPTKVTQFYKVISNISARFKIGLTATPYRADGLEKGMFALLGGIIHEVSRDAVAHTTCPIRIKRINTGWMPSEDALMGDGTIDYSKLIDDLTHDQERFDFVFGEIATLAMPMMVLANRVEYLEQMADYLNNCGTGIRAVCLSGMGNSKKAKAERKAALERLNSGDLDVVCCTYALASEGLDVPNLKHVILATPEKNPTTVTQSCGRVGRKAEGKTHGTVIDFIDGFGMYKSWAKKRETIYKNLKYDII